MEELVLKIQQGHDELYETLWLQVHDLIALWAFQYYRSILRSGTAIGGVTVDDLIQSGFLALVAAVEGYSPQGTAFTTYLSYHVKKVFRQAIGRTDRQLHDPLNSAFSLDGKVDEDDPDSGTWYDMAANKRDFRNYYAAVDEKIYREQLHDALETALNTLPEKEASAIRSEFWDGCSLKETAERIGCKSIERTRQIRNDGLKRIRNGSQGKMLERFLDSETSFYKGMGLAAFKQSKTSGVERAVLYRERMRKRLEAKIDRLNKMIAPD